jgi:hypothetical protein
MKITKAQLKSIIRSVILESNHGMFFEPAKLKEPYQGFLKERCRQIVDKNNDWEEWWMFAIKYTTEEELDNMWNECSKEASIVSDKRAAAYEKSLR